MIPLLATIIPLGLAAAIKPTLFGLQLMIVGTPHWYRRALAVVIGAAIPVVVWVALGFAGFTQLPAPRSGSIDVLGVSLRVVVGLGFLAAAVWFWLPHAALLKKSQAFIESHLGDGRSRTAFWLALVIQGKSITMYALLLPALHDIGVAPVDLVERLIALAMLIALVLSVVLIPIALGLMFSRSAHNPLPRLYAFAMRNQFKLVGAMALVIGLYLTGSAAAIVALAERI